MCEKSVTKVTSRDLDFFLLRLASIDTDIDSFIHILNDLYAFYIMDSQLTFEPHYVFIINQLNMIRLKFKERLEELDAYVVEMMKNEKVLQENR